MDCDPQQQSQPPSHFKVQSDLPPSSLTNHSLQSPIISNTVENQNQLNHHEYPHTSIKQTNDEPIHSFINDSSQAPKLNENQFAQQEQSILANTPLQEEDQNHVKSFIDAFKKQKSVHNETIELDSADAQLNLEDIEIDLSDSDLKQLEQYKTLQPQQLISFLQTLSLLLPRTALEQNLCSLLSHLNLIQRITTKNNISNYFQQIALENNVPASQTATQNESNNYIRRHRIRRSFMDQHGFDSHDATLDYRQNLQRKIAFVYVNRGYGLGIARQTLQEDIENNLYNTLLTSVIRASLRKLCDILISNLRMRIESFESRQEIALRSPMANCRKWMDPKDQQALYKIVTQPLYPQEVVSLYQKICGQLNRRSGLPTSFPATDPIRLNQNKTNLRTGYSSSNQFFNQAYVTPRPVFPGPAQNDHNISKTDAKPSPEQLKIKQTYEYQKEMLQLYIKYGNIERINQILKAKYNRKDSCRQSILNIIEKVIRINLRKLANAYLQKRKQGKQLPELMLRDQIVKAIMTDRDNNKFRMELLRAIKQFNPQDDSKLLTMIRLINQYALTHQLSQK